MTAVATRLPCPNGDMGPDDIRLEQIWTHDYAAYARDRLILWRVAAIDRYTGEAVLEQVSDEMSTWTETVGTLLAHWTCRVR